MMQHLTEKSYSKLSSLRTTQLEGSTTSRKATCIDGGKTSLVFLCSDQESLLWSSKKCPSWAWIKLYWFHHWQKNKLTVTTEVVQVKVRGLAWTHGILTFKASRGLVKRCMKHTGFSLWRWTLAAQKLPQGYDLWQKYGFLLHRFAMQRRRLLSLMCCRTAPIMEKGDRVVIMRTAGNDESRIRVMLLCTTDDQKSLSHGVLNWKTLPKNFSNRRYRPLQDKGLDDWRTCDGLDTGSLVSLA